MISQLSTELKVELMKRGASLVGFADLHELAEDARNSMPYGVALAVALNPAVINEILHGPTQAYYAEYQRVNQLLDELDEYAASIIRRHGYEAFPKVRKSVEVDPETHKSILPHKTVATRAGLGWIGKCALLVTKEYGSAVRLSAVLTTAPLETGTPINTSSCGNCTICKAACPGGAVHGENWKVGLARESFFDAHVCRQMARERAGKVGLNETICGLCIRVCPQTKRYLTRAGFGE